MVLNMKSLKSFIIFFLIILIIIPITPLPAQNITTSTNIIDYDNYLPVTAPEPLYVDTQEYYYSDQGGVHNLSATL